MSFSSGFAYRKTVQFYETDQMGIVHHSNYIRYFEEARVAWLRDVNLLHMHSPFADLTLAVISSSCKHHSTARFTNEVEVRLQVRLERAKMRFQYAVYLMSDALQGSGLLEPSKQRLVASGETLHIALDGQLRVVRVPEAIAKYVESEEWTETWP